MMSRDLALHPRDTDGTFHLSPAPKLVGARVLISGAGTGIGRGAALEFAREGAKVAIHYYNEEEGAQSAAKLIRDAGGDAECFQADFKDIADVQKLATAATDYLEGVDILVNNSGITATLPFLETTPQQFDTLFSVNVKAAYFLTQMVAPQMIKRQSGRIINLGSPHASTASTEHSVYAATKAAVEAFTRVIAIELAPHGIRVNCICPGWCLTENHFKANPSNTDFSLAAHTIPAGYISSPSDLGKLMVFLCSNDADYFVGETIKFTGGISALMPNSGDFRKPRDVRYGGGYVEGIE